LFQRDHLHLRRGRCFGFELEGFKLIAHALEQDPRLYAVSAGQNVTGSESNTQRNPGPHHPFAKHR
jgi:hypothetical protein